MSNFRATNLTTGDVIEYATDIPQAEHLGDGWRLEDVSDAVGAPGVAAVPATIYGGRRRLTKLEFIALLGDSTFVAILSMAHASVEIEVFVKMIDLATPDPDGTSIDLDDPRTVAGLNALEHVLIASGKAEAGWSEGVLNG